MKCPTSCGPCTMAREALDEKPYAKWDDIDRAMAKYIEYDTASKILRDKTREMIEAGKEGK